MTGRFWPSATIAWRCCGVSAATGAGPVMFRVLPIQARYGGNSAARPAMCMRRRISWPTRAALRSSRTRSAARAPFAQAAGWSV